MDDNGRLRQVDLVRYVAWLVHERHAAPANPMTVAFPLEEAAHGVAALVVNRPKGHGEKFTRKHEAVIAALLTEPTHGGQGGGQRGDGAALAQHAGLP